MIADVHDWGTHPYATADEKGPSLTLYMYNAQEKSVPPKRKNPALRDKGRPVWKPPGTGTVQLRDVHTRVYTDHLMSRLRLALVELGDTYRKHHSV